MSDEAGAPPAGVEAGQNVKGLAYVCGHLDEISAVLGEVPDGDGQEALKRLMSALHGSGDIAGPLAEVHHALLRAGDALGVYGHVRGLRNLTLAGIEDSTPLEIVYRCPAGRCPRTVPGSAAPPPRCGILGQELRWGQL